MAGIRDIDSGKVYIGQEEPERLDQSTETLNGDKPYDGTLAVTGPAFIGYHEGGYAKGMLNVGLDLGDFSPGVSGRAVDISGDMYHLGNTTHLGGLDQTGDQYVDGNVNITGTMSCGHATWSSSIVATTKLFEVDHPNIDNYLLRHGCLEGPEHAIFVRGKVSVDGIIDLPDYWQNFVNKETITVQLTPIGCYQELFVERIDYGKTVRIKNSAGGTINAYYQVWADRAGEKLIVEYEGKSAADYPGDSSMYSVAGYDYDVRDQETKTRKKGRFDKK